MTNSISQIAAAGRLARRGEDHPRDNQTGTSGLAWGESPPVRPETGVARLPRLGPVRCHQNQIATCPRKLPTPEGALPPCRPIGGHDTSEWQTAVRTHRGEGQDGFLYRSPTEHDFPFRPSMRT